MTHYVVGFACKGDRILLIRKSKPAWQAGKLNGVGGKVEPEEDTVAAMCREFKEETDIHTFPGQWQGTVVLQGKDWMIWFFIAREIDIDGFRQMEFEKPEIVKISDLWKINCIPNLRWLIPMSLDRTIRFPIIVDDTYP